MSKEAWLWLGFALGLVAVTAGTVSFSPKWQAELQWQLSSIIKPAEKAGVRLQK